MKKLLTISFIAANLLGGIIFSQGNNSNSNNGQGVTQWKTNGNVADSNHFIGTTNEFPVKFRTNNTERIRISAEGNVGIGTSQPEAKLDVNGSVILRDNFKLTSIPFTNGIPNTILVLDANGNVNKAPILALSALIYSDFVVCEDIVPQPVWSNGPNKIFVACPNVRVGIGTSDPSHSLHTVGDVLFNGSLQTQGEVLFANTLRVNGSVGFGTSPSTFSRFKIDGSNYGAALEINQSNSSDYSKLLLLYYTNPLTEIIKVVNGQTNNVAFLLESSGKMTIHNGTIKTFQVDQNGILYSRTVKVDVYDWPDFVFNEDYNLPTLEFVKDYISENGHLPSIPNAKTIEADGVDLGEMNKLLLQKIEELTLYLIEQNKRIEILENLNKD